jgi:uroporphyrinogen decarboxylase
MYNLDESLLIRSLRCQAVERTPIWLMRQAGRYLPEYRAVRARAGSFMQLCQSPDLACEVTLQPLRRFALDAAILFSDILTIPDAMGLGLSFIDGEGPHFARPIRSVAAIEALPVPVIEDDLSYVMDAVRLIRREMPAHLPLIGFSGSPWTLACYMLEGGSSRDFKHALPFMYTHPVAMHQLLSKLTQAVIDYLLAQVAAGVNALMLFDTWGGILSTPCFQAFSCDYMAQIVAQVKESAPHIPLILFTKGGGAWLPRLLATGCDALSVDWTCDLNAARNTIAGRAALQGHLDPSLLLTNPACIRAGVQDVLAAYGAGAGHVFNLGHGITPDVPADHVRVLVDAVHELSPAYH